MEPTTEQFPPTLNLAKEVDQDTYRATITRLYHALEDVGQYHGWCGARHDYFQCIYPEHVGKRHQVNYTYHDCDPDWSLTPETADYASVLTVIRKRILWYANQDGEGQNIKTANVIFQKSGLPLYPVKVPLRRFQIATTFVLSVDDQNTNPYELEEWLGNPDNLADLMNGTAHDIRVVPGSYEAPEGSVYADYIRPDQPVIPESDMLYPGKHRD